MTEGGKGAPAGSASERRAATRRLNLPMPSRRCIPPAHFRRTPVRVAVGEAKGSVARDAGGFPRSQRRPARRLGGPPGAERKHEVQFGGAVVVDELNQAKHAGVAKRGEERSLAAHARQRGRGRAAGRRVAGQRRLRHSLRAAAGGVREAGSKRPGQTTAHFVHPPGLPPRRAP